MAKENFISFRADDDFSAYLKQLAENLTKKEGRVVRVTDVIWRIIDAGLPVLRSEIDEELGTEVAHLLHKKFEISAALRSTRSALRHLESLVSP